MERTGRHILDNDIKVEYSKYGCFYAAGLVLLNIQTSESHNSKQCHEWLLYVRSTVNAVSYGSNTLRCVLG